MPEVRVIQPTILQTNKQRVCAYARVSSDSEDQLNSFAVQVEYYTGYIQEQEGWEFAGIYADEGISGTTIDKRDEFQRLLQDCRAGKIDRILVKSISRFSRNLTDCIKTVRELKRLGVSIEFEKEHIDTGKLGSEMLLTMLGSAAQEESISISKNLQWSYQKRMSSGEFITCSAPLGYFLKDHTLVPNPEEVPIVEYIFHSYLGGKSIDEIVREMNDMEMKTIRENSARWHYMVIRRILSNEKYIGNSFVQKYFTPEEIPFKRKRNDGQVPKYYLENSHPAIISKEVFEAVQELLKQKSRIHAPKKEMQQFPLSRMMKCGLCGSTFYRRPNGGYIRWMCYRHRQSKDLCKMGIVQEKEVHEAFLNLYHKLLEHKEEILTPMLCQLKELQGKILFSKPDVIRLNQQISELMKQNHSLSRLQSKGCIDSALFVERSTKNNQQLAELQGELRRLREPDSISEMTERTKTLLDLLEEASPMLEFDPDVFKVMITNIVIHPNKFCFHLVNGLILDEGR